METRENIRIDHHDHCKTDMLHAIGIVHGAILNPPNYMASATNDVPAASLAPGTLDIIANCNSGDFATGGGYSDTDGLFNYKSEPVTDASGVPPIWLPVCRDSPSRLHILHPLESKEAPPLPCAHGKRALALKPPLSFSFRIH